PPARDLPFHVAGVHVGPVDRDFAEKLMGRTASPGKSRLPHGCQGPTSPSASRLADSKPKDRIPLVPILASTAKTRQWQPRSSGCFASRQLPRLKALASCLIRHASCKTTTQTSSFAF